jgi:hypothetical protein
MVDMGDDGKITDVLEGGHGRILVTKNRVEGGV